MLGKMRIRLSRGPCLTGDPAITAMTKPAKLPQVLGVLGFALGIANIAWQIHTYRESFTERVIERLSAEYILKGNKMVESVVQKEKGNLWIEIVNTGQRPTYLKELLVRPCNPLEQSPTHFYPVVYAAYLGQSPLMLDPGASHTFKQAWDFGADPIGFTDTPEPSPNCVYVWTTKGLILKEPAHLTAQSFIFNLKEPK